MGIEVRLASEDTCVYNRHYNGYTEYLSVFLMKNKHEINTHGGHLHLFNNSLDPLAIYKDGSRSPMNGQMMMILNFGVINARMNKFLFLPVGQHTVDYRSGI